MPSHFSFAFQKWVVIFHLAFLLKLFAAEAGCSGLVKLCASAEDMLANAT